jgi:hypothetical protein
LKKPAATARSIQALITVRFVHSFWQYYLPATPACLLDGDMLRHTSLTRISSGFLSLNKRTRFQAHPIISSKLTTRLLISLGFFKII